MRDTTRLRILADLASEHRKKAHGTDDAPKYTCDLCIAYQHAIDADLRDDGIGARERDGAR